jgi:cell division protein FtsL
MWSPSFVFKRMAFQWIEVRWMAKFVLALIIKHLLIACPFLTLMFHQLINCYFTLQVSDEAKYIKSSIFDRTRQLEELHARVGENSTVETTDKKAFEDEIQNSQITVKNCTPACARGSGAKCCGMLVSL